MKTIKIETTKRGAPAAWESGGGMTNTGKATLVTGPAGEKLVPIYVPRGGHLAGGNHALLPLRQGYYILSVSTHGGGVNRASVQRVLSTSVRDVDGVRFEATAEVETVAEWSNGEWAPALPDFLAPAFRAAVSKCRTYHCRHAVWTEPQGPRKELTPEQKTRQAARHAAQDAERQALRDKIAAEKAAAAEAARQASIAAGRGPLGDQIRACATRLAELETATSVECFEDGFRLSGGYLRAYEADELANLEYVLRRAEENAAEEAARRQEAAEFEAPVRALLDSLSAHGVSNQPWGEFSVWVDGVGEQAFSREGFERLQRLLAEKLAEQAERQ